MALPTASVRRVRRGRVKRAERPHTRLIDLVEQAVRAMSGRRLRSWLTVVGIALGIGATVATIGVSATAGAAISDRFDALKATQVTIRWTEGAARPEPARSVQARTLNGVVAAGLLCQAVREERIGRISPLVGDGPTVRVNVFAAEPQALNALNVSLVAGRSFDEGHGVRGDPVAVLDTVAARDLGIDPVANPLVWLGDTPIAVLGVVQAPSGEARFTRAVFLPYEICRSEPGRFRQPDAVIRTRLGAADQVAHEARLALSPEDPDAVAALVPPDLRTFRRGVESDTRALFLGLALVSLIIGALGISNTTFVAVLERRSEIGLRRAVGASRRAVAGQFLLESATLGLAGGALGTVVGIDVVAVTAIAQGWLVVLDPLVVVAGPAVGLAIGTLAGIYPAWAASKVPPAVSLRA